MSKKVLLIILLWSVIVIGWVLKSEYTLNLGREVILETVPVDPRDLFMGDYVILGFKIGQLRYSERKNYDTDIPVYVYLNVNGDNIASRSRVTQTKPASDSNDLYIKGKAKRNIIEFGIENYYVKEKTGKNLEKELRNGGLVKVKIDKFGNAKVVGFVNG